MYPGVLKPIPKFPSLPSLAEKFRLILSPLSATPYTSHISDDLLLQIKASILPVGQINGRRGSGGRGWTDGSHPA